jgi:hypothetical protein
MVLLHHGTATALIEESQKLRVALRACRDRSALLLLKSAATIFRSRMLVEHARDRLASVKSWREYRNKP